MSRMFKLEPPDSPASQEHTPEYDLSPDNASYRNDWMTRDTSNSPIYDDNDDYTREIPRKLCRVCGDVASGLHYGVPSCEACKAFFKRTIQSNMEYTCPNSGCCEVNRSNRKACQSCRFQKCLEMGMLREGVRPDRVRGGRQKYKRTNDAPYQVIRATKSTTASTTNLRRSSTNNHNNNHNNHNNHHHNHHNNHMNNNNNNNAAVNIKMKPAVPKAAKPIGHSLLHSLKSNEQTKVYAEPDKYDDDDEELKFRSTLSELTDKELLAILNWAKNIPGFSSLSIPDSLNLLRSTWLDIICLNITYRSLPYSGDIVYADNFRISEDVQYDSADELHYALRRLTRKLADINLTHEEYLFLKALLLFNPDVNLENVAFVQQQRTNVLEGLLEYEGFQRDSKLPHRVSDLLLLLPMIVQAKYITRDFFWLSVVPDDNIVLSELVSEVFQEI